MRTNTVPANPRGGEGGDADLPSVPAPRWRVTAAALIDYMLFSLLWALVLGLLDAVAPLPGWSALPVFATLWWMTVRRRRTPGMLALSLARVRLGPGPGPRDKSGTVLWVAPKALLERENALSVAIGLLFVVEGLHLCGLALGDGAGLPPGLRDLGWPVDMVATVLWGGVWVWAGRGLLRLRPEARVAGILLMVVCVGVVTRWPDTWGAWFAEGLVGHRARFGDLAVSAFAERVGAWFVAAVWGVCAPAALLIGFNRAPFRRPQSAPDQVPAPPAARKAVRGPRTYDMPVAQAAQVTALVMAIGILAGWSLSAWADAWGDHQDRDSRQMVETALPRIATGWDPEALASVATVELRHTLRTDDGRAAFARYACLGALTSVEAVSGEAFVKVLLDGTELSATYTVEARFENAPARVEVLMMRRGKRWEIRTLRIESPALTHTGWQGVCFGAGLAP